MNKEDLPWKDFPEHFPKEPGKYLVEFECDGRTWTLIALWRRHQAHHRIKGQGHVTEPEPVWLLGMEFHDTKIQRFVDIKL